MTLEITLREAKIILAAISGYLPPKDDEMISFMLYHRIKSKVEKNE